MLARIKTLTGKFNKKAKRVLGTAFFAATRVIDGKIPKFVPRDRTTKILIGTGAAAYLCDIWDPFPIGETMAVFFAAAATARGGFLHHRANNARPCEGALLTSNFVHTHS